VELVQSFPFPWICHSMAACRVGVMGWGIAGRWNEGACDAIFSVVCARTQSLSVVPLQHPLYFTFCADPARSGMQQGRGVLSCAGNPALQHSLGPVVRASAKQLCET
jgi:hypothetical protein